MKVSVVMDGRFEWANGNAYSSHMAYYPFAERLLSVFDEVEICARAYDIISPTGKPVAGPGASFVRLGNYRGARSFVRQLPRLTRSLWRLAGSSSPVLAYLPGTLPLMFGFMRLVRGKELYSLVVADPADQLQSGALRHPLRGIARITFISSLRYLLSRSSGAMYVTRTYLQCRYPITKGEAFATSDVLIRESDLGLPRPASDFRHAPIKLIYVAMMAQDYKGHDDLLHAVAKVRAAGTDVRLKLVGDGPLRPKIEALARDAGIADLVTFTGKISHGSQMMEQLDSSDIFVMTSRAEGLPRAMVEAMARGLPVISTNVGGVSELVSEYFTVAPNNPAAFADKLVSIASMPDCLSRASAKNLEVAKYYLDHKVDQRIKLFYRFIVGNARSAT